MRPIFRPNARVSDGSPPRSGCAGLIFDGVVAAAGAASAAIDLAAVARGALAWFVLSETLLEREAFSRAAGTTFSCAFSADLPGCWSGMFSVVSAERSGVGLG